MSVCLCVCVYVAIAVGEEAPQWAAAGDHAILTITGIDPMKLR